jgi:hypothetical protein
VLDGSDDGDSEQWLQRWTAVMVVKVSSVKVFRSSLMTNRDSKQRSQSRDSQDRVSMMSV